MQLLYYGLEVQIVGAALRIMGYKIVRYRKFVIETEGRRVAGGLVLIPKTLFMVHGHRLPHWTRVPPAQQAVARAAQQGALGLFHHKTQSNRTCSVLSSSNHILNAYCFKCASLHFLCCPKR